MSPERPTPAMLAAATLFHTQMRAVFWALAEESRDVGVSGAGADELEPIVENAVDTFGDALAEWAVSSSFTGPGRDTASGGCGGSP